ncbi:hypothetical protein H5410_017765 [Solanum commersonii]|uniref:Uncharacterized protein n=1 Tax=Solanum commersonii TaxID=4109 RepID=A0A9J6A038_SOLCO|nr:hypothetical protein H5410_017765 [Solanum commersonii]
MSSGSLTFSMIQTHSVSAFFNEEKSSQQRMVVIWQSLDANELFNLLRWSGILLASSSFKESGGIEFMCTDILSLFNSRSEIVGVLKCTCPIKYMY